MSAAKCAKCRGLLPPWLTATADAGNARCPNCGHVNDLNGSKTPGPVELASSRQTPVVSQSAAAAASKTPAPVKPVARPAATIVGHAIQDPERLRAPRQAAAGGRAQAAPAQAAPVQAQAAPAQAPAPGTPPPRKAFAATMIMHAPAKVAPREEPPTQSKKKTLTEIAAFVPAEPVAASPVAAAPAVLPPAATEPVGHDLTEIVPDVPDFSVEIESDAPPAVESQKPSSAGLPAWSVANNVMADADDALAAQEIARKRAKIAKISVAAVGLVGGFLLVAVGLPRSHGPKPPESAPKEAPRPIAHEPAKPVETKPVETKPVEAKPVQAKATAPRPEPKVADAKPEVAKPRPPEPVKPAVVAKAAEPPPSPARTPAEAPAAPVARRSSGPSEADLKRAHDAYMEGNAKLFKGQVDEAIVAFKESVKLDSRNAAAHRGLGLAYVQAGNPANALRELKKYLRAAPTAPDRALIEKRIEQLSSL